MDDRAGFVTLLRAAELLRDTPLDVELYLMGSRTFITSTEEQLGGIWVVLYALYSVWLAVLTFFSLALPLIRLRRENRRLRIQMEEQYKYYQIVLATQLQLREIRHDLKNRLVAETEAKERKKL